MSHQDLRRQLRIQPGADHLDLDDLSTDRVRTGPGSKKKSLRTLASMGAELAELQERLFAAATGGDRRSVLLVLQGMDTAGKGGVIDHVVGLVGPSGAHIRAFKKPTPEELSHDFLWRIRNALPGPGQIGVFDRSHYEDVLVPVVHQQIDEGELIKRYAMINEFEAELAEQGTTVIKCFLHLSYDRQRDRLLARLDDPTKYWKFNEGDVTERRLWPDYQRAYARAMAATSTEIAPWYAVPSDHKWYRNWAVATILLDTLRDLDPQYPRTDLDLPRLRQRLAPPN